MGSLPAKTRFSKLVDDISAFYVEARESQIQFGWNTGRRIVEEEQNGAVRAEYGTQLLENLSGVLTRKFGKGFSVRTLCEMRQFYINNKILRPAAELTWTNHVQLMRVKDPKIRKELTKQAVSENLNKYDLRALIRSRREETEGTNVPAATKSFQPDPPVAPVKPAKPLPPLKRPTDLKLNTYARFNSEEIDCGFYISRPATASELKGITITSAPSYTYTAVVERVIDGDTLCVGINVGFGNTLHDKLRLRGINCPELPTPEGKAAKLYVQKLLPVGSLIVIKSRKVIVDTYGRFVMDVFYSTTADSTPEEIIASGKYLNQDLLDAGHAERMGE
jgi:endonuclease YncB( thermonuclease family)